jgi:hypothetical protein
MSSELNKKLLHLTQISSVAMRIQKSKLGTRMFPQSGYYFIAGFCIEQANVDVLVSRQSGEDEASILLLFPLNVVGGWIGREEGEFGGDAGRYVSHFKSLS